MTELDLVEDVVRVGSTALSLLRPRDAEALLDEDAFAEDEFLPYWAELWPAGLALGRALPAQLDGVRVVDWRDLEGDFDLALAADVLYEHRNVEPLLTALPRLAPEALVALAGRPYEAEFLRRVDTETVAERVVRVRR